MAPPHEAIERARPRRTGAPQCAGPSGEDGRPMTVTAVELDFCNAALFRLPAAQTRLVAAKFDSGCERRPLDEHVMKARGRNHAEQAAAQRSSTSLAARARPST